MALLILAGLVLPGAPALAQSASVEPRALEAVRTMSDHLAGAGALAFRAEISLDELHRSGIKVTRSGERTMAVRRPNRVVTDVSGDLGERTTWYAGDVVAVHDKSHHTYAVLDIPDDLPRDIDVAIDFVADAYDIVLPLSDFIRTDVYESLVDSATIGAYLGISRVGGARCHHVGFANEYLEWQLWIDAETEPVPRKFVINYKDEPSEPRYTARFESWNLAADLPDELFEFSPPEGATEMKMERMVDDSRVEREDER